MADITNSEWIQQNNARIDAIKAKANTLPDGSVSPNIFVQTIEPTVKKGLWLQTNKTAEHYVCDENVYYANEWEPIATTPHTPYNAGDSSVVNIGTDIYLFGGNSTNGVLAYKYDTLTDIWTQLSDIPYTFAAGGATVVGTDIYLFGGGGGKKTAYKYDTLLDTYTQLTNIPFDFTYNSAVSVGTDIYLCCSSTSNRSSVYKYDTLTDTYTSCGNVPQSNNGGHCVAIAVGTDVYILGNGAFGSRYYNYKYDTLNGIYTQMARIPADGYSWSGTLVGADIYLFNSTKQYKYNIPTDTWTTLSDTPRAVRSGNTTVYVDSKIYSVGYYNSDTAVYDGIDIYHFNGKTYPNDNSLIIAQGRSGRGATYNIGYAIELFDTNFDENFKPLYGLVDAWFYTIQDGIISDIPTYYGDGTQWIKFKN